MIKTWSKINQERKALERIENRRILENHTLTFLAGMLITLFILA